jgi:hypothetical protein
MIKKKSILKYLAYVLGVHHENTNSANKQIKLNYMIVNACYNWAYQLYLIVILHMVIVYIAFIL